VADHSPKVTSVTSIDGHKATAIWEPLTLTKYQSLRASTTVTLTETATATNGSSEVETVVAVVFAGGVAWWLAGEFLRPDKSKRFADGVGKGQIGFGAALGLTPPTSQPEGSKKDDKNCKANPKRKCNDCGGADLVGLCRSPPENGCMCSILRNSDQETSNIMF
jgi:hypothetical protein